MTPKLTTEKKIVDIDLVEGNPWNPNTMSDFIYERMKATIKEKGLFGSIICRPHLGAYQILDGEHRHKACKELGMKEIPIEVSINEISDQETKFWTLYFNNTKGKDEIEKVVEILNSIDAGQSSLLPYTEEEIKNTKDLFAFDFSKYEKSDIDLPQDEMVNILSFKFSNEEWAIVQEALNCVKSQHKTNKQWFMSVLQQYLRKEGLHGGFVNIK